MEYLLSILLNFLSKMNSEELMTKIQLKEQSVRVNLWSRVNISGDAKKKKIVKIYYTYYIH